MSRSRYHASLLATRSSWPPFAGHPDQACADVDPEVFYPPSEERAKTTVEAKRICRRCPLAAECADWATRTHQEYGIWGATTPNERVARRKAAA